MAKLYVFQVVAQSTPFFEQKSPRGTDVHMCTEIMTSADLVKNPSPNPVMNE